MPYMSAVKKDIMQVCVHNMEDCIRDARKNSFAPEAETNRSPKYSLQRAFGPGWFVMVQLQWLCSCQPETGDWATRKIIYALRFNTHTVHHFQSFSDQAVSGLLFSHSNKEPVQLRSSKRAQLNFEIAGGAEIPHFALKLRLERSQAQNQHLRLKMKWTAWDEKENDRQCRPGNTHSLQDCKMYILRNFSKAQIPSGDTSGIFILWQLHQAPFSRLKPRPVGIPAIHLTAMINLLLAPIVQNVSGTMNRCYSIDHIRYMTDRARKDATAFGKYTTSVN